MDNFQELGVDDDISSDCSRPRSAPVTTNELSRAITLADPLPFTPVTGNEIERLVTRAKQHLETPTNYSSKWVSRWANHATELGIFLAKRSSASASDLDSAVELLRKVVDATPGDHADRYYRLSSFCSCLNSRFYRSRNMEDIEESILFAREALALTPQGHPSRAASLCNLSNLLQSRSIATGAAYEIDEVILNLRQAMEITQESDCDYDSYLASLASHLEHRHSRTKKMVDLDEAIRLGRRRRLTGKFSSSQSTRRFRDLARQLAIKHRDTGELSCLEEAISVAQEDIQMLPPGHRSLAAYHDDLGRYFWQKFLKLRQKGDLEKSIESAQAAVDIAPLKHPEGGRYWINLGTSLGALYFIEHGNMSHIEKALEAYEFALYNPHYNITDRIHGGRNIIRFHEFDTSWKLAYNSSRVVISLLPKLGLRSLNNVDKRHMLEKISGFASEATSAAVNAYIDPTEILALLEQGRGMLSKLIEGLRPDLLGLKKEYPDLAERFCKLQHILDSSMTENHWNQDDNTSSWGIRSQQRYDANVQFDELTKEIRTKPGFELFLRPPHALEMRVAALYGPVVVINASVFRCDAILIELDQIRLLPLPQVTNETIKEMKKTSGSNLGAPAVLRWLWYAIAQPVLDSLGLTGPPTGDDSWPHVWWIPVGLLCEFPIHAAGLHDKLSSETVMDRVISSYHSSVTGLIHSRRRRSKTPLSSRRVVVVAMEHTPGYSSLPFARKEIDTLRPVFTSMGFDVIQPRPERTDVLAQISPCGIFHFAGHGHADHLDPLQGKIILGQGNRNSLKVADLLEINFRDRPPFLAYLSACGTSQLNEEKLRDENIHLASAFELAGFRHVIGTLWQAHDETCMRISKMMYEWIKDFGVTDEAVCRGLHHAMRRLRDEWIQKTRDAESMERTRAKGGKQQGTEGADVVGGRDIVCDDEEELAPQSWVPFIHFGI